MSKWVPGQKLNSAAEVMQALLDGEKVRRGFWHSTTYVKLVDGQLQNTEPGGTRHAVVDADDVYVYTPPKRKIKSERWCPVVYDGVSGLDWIGFYSTEAEAKYSYPSANAYARVVVEVEVDGNS